MDGSVDVVSLRPVRVSRRTVPRANLLKKCRSRLKKVFNIFGRGLLLRLRHDSKVQKKAVSKVAHKKVTRVTIQK